jgi:hypothetical protein
MKSKLIGLIAAAVVAVPTMVSANSIYDWSYVDSAVSATGTLEVGGGQALNGTGTITSATYLGGTQSLTLVTLSTTNVHDLGGGHLSYRFGGGTDLIGDTTFNSGDPWLSDWGLVFTVGGSGNNGFNIWADSASAGGSYTSFLAGNTNYRQGSGAFTATLAPVPLPAALPMLLSGLGGFGALARRRRKSAQA